MSSGNRKASQPAMTTITAAPYLATASPGAGSQDGSRDLAAPARRRDLARNLAMPSTAARNTIGMTVAS